ncbi:MAG: hypothetical protein HY903_05445 [Deltaproteobacteria bacterium]|nr:hypothetical protein [Deltaproteobacteria bacterium]
MQVDSNIGALLVTALLGPSCGCVVQVVDLQSDAAADDTDACPAGTRRHPETGACVPCETLPPPEGVCPCAALYHTAPFPYCTGPESYYVCLPCRGGLDACIALTIAGPGELGRLGTTRDCGRVLDCCSMLAADSEAPFACCPCGSGITCAADPRAPGELVVSCDPFPMCCGGDASCPSFACAEACGPPGTTGFDACCADCGCLPG